MRSTVNGAVRRATARAASTRPRASTATALAATSASGAAPHPMVPAASTARLEGMRSEAMRRRKRAEEHKLTLNSSVDFSRVKSSNALQMFQNSYKSPRLCASAGNIKPRAHSTAVFRLTRVMESSMADEKVVVTNALVQKMVWREVQGSDRQFPRRRRGAGAPVD